MTSEYVLSWIDPEQPRNDDGSLNWHEELYQTQRSCAEALLAKPVSGLSYYVNGTSTSRAMARSTVDFYQARDYDRQIWLDSLRQAAVVEAERHAQLEEARRQAVIAVLIANKCQPIERRLQVEALADFLIGAYNSVKEV